MRKQSYLFCMNRKNPSARRAEAKRLLRPVGFCVVIRVIRDGELRVETTFRYDASVSAVRAGMRSRDRVDPIGLTKYSIKRLRPVMNDRASRRGWRRSLAKLKKVSRA